MRRCSIAIQIKCGGADITFGEQFTNFAGLGIWKRDKGLFGSSQIRRSLMFAKGPLKTLYAAIDVGVQQCQKPSKVFRVTLVRRGCHQQVMVGHL